IPVAVTILGGSYSGRRNHRPHDHYENSNVFHCFFPPTLKLTFQLLCSPRQTRFVFTFSLSLNTPFREKLRLPNGREPRGARSPGPAPRASCTARSCTRYPLSRWARRAPPGLLCPCIAASRGAALKLTGSRFQCLVLRQLG